MYIIKIMTPDSKIKLFQGFRNDGTLCRTVDYTHAKQCATPEEAQGYIDDIVAWFNVRGANPICTYEEYNTKKTKSKVSKTPTRKKVEAFLSKQNAEYKDTLYRVLWKEHVKEDAADCISNNYGEFENEHWEEISDLVAERYVFEGDYDCNQDYWTNIENLIFDVANTMR